MPTVVNKSVSPRYAPVAILLDVLCKHMEVEAFQAASVVVDSLVEQFNKLASEEPYPITHVPHVSGVEFPKMEATYTFTDEPKPKKLKGNK